MFAILKLILLKKNMRIEMVGIKHDILNTTRPPRDFQLCESKVWKCFICKSLSSYCATTSRM